MNKACENKPIHVTAAKAVVQFLRRPIRKSWIPAFAGMTADRSYVMVSINTIVRVKTRVHNHGYMF